MTSPAPLHPQIFDCWLITFTLYHSLHNFFAIFLIHQAFTHFLCIIRILWCYLSASTIFPSISHLRVIHSQFSLRTWHHLHLLHSGFKLEALKLDSHGLGGVPGFTMFQLVYLFLYFIQSSTLQKGSEFLENSTCIIGEVISEASDVN